MDVGTITKYVTGRAEDIVLNRSGLRRVGQSLRDSADSRRSANALKDPGIQRDLLSQRVHHLIAKAAEELKGAKKLDPEQAAELFDSQQVRLIEAARSHGQLLQWEALTQAIEGQSGRTAEVLTWVRDLFALTLIEKNLGWYLSHGYISSRRARTLEPYLNRLLERIEPHALELVEAFGYQQPHLRAEISTGIEKIRQDEAAEYYRKLRASSTAPVDEKKMSAQPGSARS